MATTSTTKKTTTPVKATAPTVSYNPKTGAKLKAGESVTVNGKTYTQGSTNTAGVTATSSTKSTSSSTPKVGIIKTSPAKGSGYSTAPAKTSGMSIAKPVATANAINPTKASVIKYPTVTPEKTSTFGNPFAGNFFKNVVGGAATAFSGAKNTVKKVATAANTAIGKGNFQANASESFAQKAATPAVLDSKTVAAPQTALDYSNNELNVAKIGGSQWAQQQATKNMRNEANTQSIVNGFLTSTGQPITTPVPSSGGSGILPTKNVGKNAQTTALDTPVTTEKTTIANPDGSTTVRTTNGLAAAPATSSYNPDTVSKAGNIMSVLTENVNQSKADPYNKYNQKGDMLKYTDTALTNLAGLYTDPAKALSDYQTNPDFKAQIDAFTKMTGKTINDVAAKIQPVTNGITGAQTTAQYLAANNTPITGVGNNGEKAILTEQQQFNAKQVAAMNAELETQKSEAKTLIEFYEKQEMRQDKSEREKAQFAIDKARAEYEAADAEAEQNRIVATDNLKNFLAKIGALSTDGAAGVGLANLEQKYQAQRAALRSNFQLATREIEINMNDHINSLESARDEKIFKLNQDLSKSEREISLDVMKLNHETQQDILQAKLKYQESIQAEKKKAAASAASALKGWEAAFFDTAATADYFNSLPAEFKASWKANNAPSTNGTRTTLTGDKGLVQDFTAYTKNNSSTLNMTPTQEFDLQKQGVDVAAYKSDAEYRAFINSKIQ